MSFGRWVAIMSIRPNGSCVYCGRLTGVGYICSMQRTTSWFLLFTRPLVRLDRYFSWCGQPGRRILSPSASTSGSASEFYVPHKVPHVDVAVPETLYPTGRCKSAAFSRWFLACSLLKCPFLHILRNKISSFLQVAKVARL